MTDQPPPAPADADAPAPAGTAAFRRHAGELDLFAGRHAMSGRRLAAIIAIAALLAAALNARALAIWAIDLPLWLGPVREAVVTATRTWAEWMSGLGLDQPYETIRAAFRWLQFWRPGG